MRYQVKWTDKKGDIRYGIIRNRDLLNKKEYKNIPAGYSIVDDAILPQALLVKDADLTDVPFSYPGEFDKYVEKDAARAEKVSKALKGKVAPGALFSIGVADGHACYMVTKVNKNTCDVEWRGYGGGDRYTDHYFGWGRKGVAKEDIQRYVRSWS